MKRRKRSKDRKIYDKCTNGTNRRSRVWPVCFIYIIVTQITTEPKCRTNFALRYHRPFDSGSWKWNSRSIHVTGRSDNKYYIWLVYMVYQSSKKPKCCMGVNNFHFYDRNINDEFPGIFRHVLFFFFVINGWLFLFLYLFMHFLIFFVFNVCLSAVRIRRPPSAIRRSHPPSASALYRVPYSIPWRPHIMRFYLLFYRA